MSKNRRMPDGGTAVTRSASARSASGARGVAIRRAVGVVTPGIYAMLGFEDPSPARSIRTPARPGAPAFGGGPPIAQSLSADTALLLLVAWLAAYLVVAAGFTERAEITG